MIPIGRGQRELVIGDRQTGKTAIILDTFLNQKSLHEGDDEKHKLYCVYVAIGPRSAPPSPSSSRSWKTPARIKYSIVVAATASDPAPMQYIAPFARLRHGRVFPRQRQCTR